MRLRLNTKHVERVRGRRWKITQVKPNNIASLRTNYAEGFRDQKHREIILQYTDEMEQWMTKSRQA